MRVNGAKIKELREKLGISASELASAADRTERWLNMVQNGQCVNINLHIAKAIAKKLKCKLGDISK